MRRVSKRVVLAERTAVVPWLPESERVLGGWLGDSFSLLGNSMAKGVQSNKSCLSSLVTVGCEVWRRNDGFALLEWAVRFCFGFGFWFGVRKSASQPKSVSNICSN